MGRIDLDAVRSELTPAQQAQAARLANRYSISVDSATLAVWADTRNLAVNDGMNQLIRYDRTGETQCLTAER